MHECHLRKILRKAPLNHAARVGFMLSILGGPKIGTKIDRIQRVQRALVDQPTLTFRW